MYQYKFIRIDINFWTGKPSIDYRQVIKEQAEQGWRLVQLFAPMKNGQMSHRYYEIILEKPLEDNLPPYDSYDYKDDIV